MNSFERAVSGYIGTENLEKIQSAKVGIAGAGGLGSNSAANLVRCGFRNFIIADFDKVEMTNLNRQFFFFNQTGMKKVDALEENLLRINGSIHISKSYEIITSANAASIFSGCDVLIEAVDSAQTKPVIIEAAAKLNIFCAAVSGIAGFGESDKITTHCMGELLVIIGDMKTGVSEESPPLSPRVSIAAAKQAEAVMNYILRK